MCLSRTPVYPVYPGRFAVIACLWQPCFFTVTVFGFSVTCDLFNGFFWFLGGFRAGGPSKGRPLGLAVQDSVHHQEVEMLRSDLRTDKITAWPLRPRRSQPRSHDGGLEVTSCKVERAFSSARERTDGATVLIAFGQGFTLYNKTWCPSKPRTSKLHADTLDREMDASEGGGMKD